MKKLQKLCVNLGSPSIVKTLKIIDIILMSSWLDSMSEQKHIDQILTLSDSPFDYLPIVELVDIINAGISEGYKFKVISGGRIRLE